MNWKAWAPLAVAVVLGLVAAITARNLLTHRTTVVAGGKGVRVVVVKNALRPGQAIVEGDVVTEPLAWSEAPEGTFKDKSEVVGRVVMGAMVKGQPVLEAELAAPGTGAGLQALVPEGMRAITIEVNEFSALAGLIGPGCAVDVVATIQEQGGKDLIAKTVVQNVKVMAVGQKVTAGTDEKAQAGDPIFKSVTLLVTPEEAEALDVASMTGRPRLVLRGNRDTAMGKSAGVSLAQLTGGGDNQSAALLAPGVIKVSEPTVGPATRPVAAVEKKTTRTIRVLKGGVESVVTVNVTPEDETGPAVGLAGGAAGYEPAVGH